MTSVVHCDGLGKTFTRSVHPSVHLQDHLLRWKKHKQRWQVNALEDITFSLRKGEWLGVYGPNGSGKTTLLLIIAGLLHKDRGSVETDGTLSCFLGLGTGFHPERTAYENIYHHMILHGVSKKSIAPLIHSVIQFAGVESHRDLPLKCYSTGMHMRLAFSAAVHIDSDVYLFDEVLAVGDEAFQKQCEEKLQSMKKAGKSAILVSHDLSQLERVCDRVLFMKQGSLSESRL